MSKKKKIILSAVVVAVLFIAVAVVTASEVMGKFFYRPTEYTIEYMVNGEVYTVEKYTVNDKDITEPRVPKKEGYDGKWESYSLDNKNLVVNAVYTPTPYKLTFTTGQGVVQEFTVDCENKAFIEPAVPEFLDFEGEWEEYSLDNLSSDIVVRALYTSRGATDGILYELYGDEYKVVGYEGISAEVYIPEYYRSKKVVGIVSNAFLDKSIIKVTLPRTVSEIQNGAFSGCSKLVEVCNNTQLDIIKGNPNYGGVALNALSVISTVEGKTNITYQSDFTFIKDGATLYLIDYPKDKTEIVLPTIGNSYSIYQDVFKGSDIKSVKFSSNVVSIKENAFENCKKLETVDFGDATSLTSIGNYAFANCPKISFVYFNGGLTQIGNYAFSNCYNLAKISIPSSFNDIGSLAQTAFYGCSNLVEAENASSLDISSALPSSVLHIYAKGGLSYISISTDGFVYYDDGIGTRLLVSNIYGDDTAIVLSLPSDSYYVLKSNALIGYTNVSELVVPSNVTLEKASLGGFDSLKHLSVYSLNNVLSEYFNGVAPVTLEKVTVSGGSICNSAFASNSSLKTVELKEGVLSIPTSAFSNCSSLTGVSIPQGLASIGDESFTNCVSLNSIVIPSSVKTIGNNAFYGCSKLTGVTFLANSTLFSIGAYAFDQSGIESFNLPATVTSIGMSCFAHCNSLKSFTFNENTTITAIAEYTFYSSGLESIEIPSSVTTINQQAFRFCSSLKELTFKGESNLERISLMAFDECSVLSNVKFPDSLKYIDASSFQNCSNAVVTVNGIKYVDNWAIGYDSTSYMTSLSFRTNTIGVAEQAFKNNIKIKEVVLNKEMKYIGEYAFYQCSYLTKVRGENSVEEIRSRAFYYCTRLTSFTLSKNVKVEDRGFYYTSNFVVYFMGSEIEWSNVTLEGSNLALTSGTKKYYSENLPALSPLSNYWRFVDGVETTWNEQ